MMQMYSSANTSINSAKLPIIYKVGADMIRGRKCVDYGCGKYDNAIEYARDNLGSTVSPYDKYNRTETVNAVTLAGSYDVSICSNVLNVIAEREIRHQVIAECAKLAPVGLYTVYEGNGSGVGGVTKADCYQLNRKTVDYVGELAEVYGSVKRKGKLIVCKR